MKVEHTQYLKETHWALLDVIQGDVNVPDFLYEENPPSSEFTM